MRSSAISRPTSVLSNVQLMKSLAHTFPCSVLGLCLLSLLATAGCSTYADRVRLAHTQFYTGELDPATETLTEYMQHYPRDADAAALDLAMVQLVSGKPAEAERTLRVVRDNFDALEQSDALESGLSMLTDDQRLAYSGQNYERVLTRVFLSLTNLLHDGQDAEAYSLQVNAKQEELLQKADAEEKEKAALVYSPLGDCALPARSDSRIDVRQLR